MNARTIAICQARIGSTRLPGKVMMDFAGLPVLRRAYDAAAAAPGVTKAVIATSKLPQDDEIAAYCLANGMNFFRGSEDDVLERFVGAAQAYDASIVLRLTCDCPLLDPTVIGEIVRLQRMIGASYASNIDPPTWPDGLDCEVFTREALEVAHKEATRRTDRDCVTRFIARNRTRFPAETLICPLPGLIKERWVLDSEDDLKFCREIAARLTRWPASYLDILAILEREPELRAINGHHKRNERFYEGLANEPVQSRSFSYSRKLLERSEKIIPFAAQTFSKSRLQFGSNAPLFMSHGDGAYIYDVDGNDYVDLVSGLLPVVLGYRDPDVDEAIRHQLNSGISLSTASELEVRLAEKLTHIIPCAEMVKFGKTGTDVTTAAVRLARAYTGRDPILICGGYHGWADWSMGTTERNIGIPSLVRECSERIPFGSIDLAELYIKNGKLAAVIVEPETNHDYLLALRELCTRHGTVLIFDEVITGFRWHLGGAQSYFGITPDLACFGKAMANGMPLSALVGRKDIMRRMAPPDNIFYSGTFFGETLSLAASLATIGKLERENVITKNINTSVVLAEGVRRLIEKHDMRDHVKFNGNQALVRVSFSSDQVKALFIQEMIQQGVLIINSHNISYAHGKDEIARILKAYDHALGLIRDALNKNAVAQYIVSGAIPEQSLRQAS